MASLCSRLLLQPRHRGVDRGQRVRAHRAARRVMAGNAADRPTPHHRLGTAQKQRNGCALDQSWAGHSWPMRRGQSHDGERPRGLFPPAVELNGGPAELDSILRSVADEDIDHLCVGDHVSFFVGAGSDGLIAATSLLAAQTELPIYVGLYLLPLRHPFPVARQLATLSQLAPGASRSVSDLAARTPMRS